MDPLWAEIYWFLCYNGDMVRVHVAAPKMLAPHSRLADLGGTVIPEQLKGQ